MEMFELTKAEAKQECIHPGAKGRRDGNTHKSDLAEEIDAERDIHHGLGRREIHGCLGILARKKSPAERP